MIKLKTIKKYILSTSLLAGAAGVFPVSAQELEADLIITNAEIYTPTGWAEAIAVSDGVILEVGDAADILSFQADDTEVMDAEGAAIFPGLHDLHVHPAAGGNYASRCSWEQGAPPVVVMDTIAGCVAEKEPGEWIIGGQWDAASFGDTPPHRSMLDEVAPNNPVLLSDISGHSTWANSMALELSGITDETLNPPGGIIERDGNGSATGVFRETAARLLRAEVPVSTLAQNAAELEYGLNEMLAHGITSFTDALVNPGSMAPYSYLADQGRLKQRVRACIHWTPAGGDPDPEIMTESIRTRNLYARERFTPDCVKVVLDGVPTDGHTAAMVEPYADAGDTDDPRARGISMLTDEVVKRAVIEFDANGLTVKFHAAGDAAVRQALDAIAAAREANGFSGVMHDSGHNSFVQMDDIERARSIGATFEMSPYIWYPNAIIPDIAAAIGPERMERWIPVKDAFDAGALVVNGSDWPVVPLVNPWIGLETLVTRQAPGGEGPVLGEQEKITLEQAFDMFTVNSALQMGALDRVGKLESGMLADMIIVDQNPFRVDVEEIHKTQVLKTIIGGELVYEAE